VETKKMKKFKVGLWFTNETTDISLYKRLNPFFRKFIMRRLQDLIEFK